MKKLVTICLFAKPPRPGEVKTRLAKSIGERAAVALASAFLADTWRAINALEWAEPVLAVTAYEGLPPLPGRPTVWLQGEGDLGARLECILRRALQDGRPAIAVGADTPGLPRRLLEQAAVMLLERGTTPESSRPPGGSGKLSPRAGADVVLGPAEDGGFYLLGMHTCPRGALAGLPWSVPETFAETAFRLAKLGLWIAQLEPWFDVDRAADLERLAALVAFGGLDAPATTRTLVELGAIPSSKVRRCA